MPASNRSKRAVPRNSEGGRPPDALSFLLNRAYYNFLGLLEWILADTGLDKYLGPGMGPILFALYEEDGLRISSIARRINVSNCNLTQLLAKMEKARLISRSRDKQDARATRVNLSPLAKRLKPRCQNMHKRLNRILNKGLRKDESMLLNRMLAQTIRNMDEARGRGGP